MTEGLHDLGVVQGMIGGLAVVLTLLCAGVMGLAIQRGSTCTVAAVQEWQRDGRLTRLAALAEASLWVGTGLLLARQWGHPAELPMGYALGPWTVAGAALLGLGAVVNRACVFGALARLGSGQWAYADTPIGFYLGCLSFGSLFSVPVPRPIDGGPPIAGWPLWLPWALAGAALARVASVLARQGVAIRAAWSPHVATLVIGIAFAVLLTLVGTWAYTDVLADLARGMASSLSLRVALCLALLAGALAGGWLAGTLECGPCRLTELARCTVGGLLMGWGSMLVPGGNDGLVLVGMPMLWPYAWAAFGVMVAVIGLALRVLEPPSPP